MTIKLHDDVVMKASVIKRTHHSDFAKNFKGTVVNVVGQTADVQTATGVRSVPSANLTVVRTIHDIRTGTTSRLIVD